tara:strand:- start:476 stop:784 length:309 start_codon:yes stop_codon:yes gene_type:complete
MNNYTITKVVKNNILIILIFISLLNLNLKLVAQTPPVINSHVTNGLLLHLDAGNSSSYSGFGNTWNDLSSSGNNGTINGATFNSTNKSFDTEVVEGWLYIFN